MLRFLWVFTVAFVLCAAIGMFWAMGCNAILELAWTWPWEWNLGARIATIAWVMFLSPWMAFMIANFEEQYR